MLIREVLSSDNTLPLLLPRKSGLQPIGPSSRTRHGWISLPAIVQYSPLRTPSHRRHGGPLPRRLPNGTRADPYAINLSTNPHAGICVTGYYATFPSTIPHIRARCSRVTHPFAGRRQVLLPALPLDLHVLSLPLAFILSQDQTLHCIISYKSSLSLALFPKETDARLKLICVTYLGTCLYFPFSLFNDLFPASLAFKNPLVFRTGLQRYTFFLN